MKRLTSERTKSGSPRVEGVRRKRGGRRSRIFLISREVIIGYLAEILILQVEGGASKCAKDYGGWPVVWQARCKGGGRSGGEGRRSGTLPGSTRGPEVVCSTFLSLMVEEERRKK